MQNNSYVSAVIPAYNEAGTIQQVISATKKYVDEIIVVDDGSTDGSAKIAESEGAIILRHEGNQNRGYYTSLRLGYESASGDIIVTLDADGQHDPSYIPLLIEPIKDKQADLVIGTRQKVINFSERVLTWLTNLCISLSDASSGFRAISSELLHRMDLSYGRCTCAIFVLEAVAASGKVIEIPLKIKPRLGQRRITTRHMIQFFIVLRKVVEMKLRHRC